MYAIYRTSTGELISLGTVVANPLPAQLTAVELSPGDAADLADGSGTWDPATKTVVPTPGWVDPEIGEDNRTAIEAQAEAALAANATFVALNPPTNAQIAAQVDALTIQMNKSIRMHLGKYDGTD